MNKDISKKNDKSYKMIRINFHSEDKYNKDISKKTINHIK